MIGPDAVIAKIREAFGDNTYPGDAYLQGSREGDEPFEEVESFIGQVDWQAVPSDLLDAHGGALSFFSEAGLRFYLPAFLVADLKGQLRYADPLMTLTMGFSDIVMNLPVGEKVFRVKSGGSALVNPRRYGALTFRDYARSRMAIFTREKAGAIVAYLDYKRDTEEVSQRGTIDAALAGFWHGRAATAPMRDELKRHVEEQEAYLKAVQEQSLGKP
jgi:hypothetical protein